MLLDDELCDDEFELRWDAALRATTSRDLDCLRYPADRYDEGSGTTDGKAK
jgi:hypothetical protein